MGIAVVVGLIGALVGSLGWILVDTTLSLPGFYNRLGQGWHWVPLVCWTTMAVLAGGQRRWAVRAGSLAASAAVTDGITNTIESYHFGSILLSTTNWLFRGMFSLLFAIFGGTFGLEGAILEMGSAFLPAASQRSRWFVEERQTFVVCALAAAAGFAFGAPFAGALLALELIHVLESRVRFAAMLSAMVAYGVGLFVIGILFPGTAAQLGGRTEHYFGAVVSAARPLQLPLSQWIGLALVALVIGVLSAMAAALGIKIASRTMRAVDQVFRGNSAIRYFAIGALISVGVYLVPDTFRENWRVWEDIAWTRMASHEAGLLLVAKAAILVLAFSGWRLSGIFSPVLFLGALGGYAVGNLFSADWGPPLAVAGAAATLAATYSVPLAAIALVFEATDLAQRGAAWWLSTIAILAAYAFVRLLRVRPLHEVLLADKGLRVIRGRVTNVLNSLSTADAMYKDVQTISDSATLSDLRDAIRKTPHNFLGVVTPEGRYLGLLALERLPARVRRLLYEDDERVSGIEAITQIVEIRDLVDRASPTVSPEEGLEKVMEYLQDAPCVAVIDPQRRLKGLLFESSIAGRYKREIANRMIRNY